MCNVSKSTNVVCAHLHAFNAGVSKDSSVPEVPEGMGLGLRVNMHRSVREWEKQLPPHNHSYPHIIIIVPSTLVLWT